MHFTRNSLMLFEVVQVLASPIGGTGGAKVFHSVVSTWVQQQFPFLLSPRHLGKIRSLSQMVGVTTCVKGTAYELPCVVDLALGGYLWPPHHFPAISSRH